MTLSDALYAALLEVKLRGNGYGVARRWLSALLRRGLVTYSLADGRRIKQGTVKISEAGSAALASEVL